jgi:5-methylcytosine-specific restriction enzyme A
MSTRENVKKAIAECDKMGIDSFLSTYGFKKEKKYTLVYKEGMLKEYPSKAIWGVANSLKSNEFCGGISRRDCAASKLKSLGFYIKIKVTKVLEL